MGRGILLLLAFSQGSQAQQCQVRMSPESFHYGNKTYAQAQDFPERDVSLIVTCGGKPPTSLEVKFSGASSDPHYFSFGDNGQIAIKLVAPPQTDFKIRPQRSDTPWLGGNLFEILPGDSFRITNMKEDTPLNLTLKIKPQINKDIWSVPDKMKLKAAITATIEEVY